MKKLILSTILTFSSYPFALAEDAHHHHTPATKVNKDEVVKVKFVADENLKVRMSKILELMKSYHQQEKDKKVTKKDHHKLGLDLETTVQDIFKNCKLEAKADQAIHPILADILKGAKEIKKSDMKKGHKLVHEALLSYEKFFIHEGWDHKE